jgi:transcriptional regulator
MYQQRHCVATAMNIEELEAQARDAIDQTLNQLQAATLLMAQLETQISETARSVQILSRLIETFAAEQRQS